MTTPPQPPIQSGRGRKRPAPGTSAPLVSSNPSTSGPAAPVTDMNYYGSLPATSAGGSNGNLYSSDPATSISAQQLQSDIYRLQTAQQQQQLHQQQQSNIYDNGSQLARVARGNQLMRVPTFSAMNVAPGIPPQISGLPSQMPMNMNIMGAPGMMGLSGGFEQPVSASEAIDRELCARIESIKKKRSNIPPFVLKLSSFVNDPNSDDLIRWSDSGNSFMVLDEEEFSKKLIPDLFKHNNYASFVRQLNMYGFHKVVGLADGSLKTSEQRSKPPSEYENPYFKRGQPDLMWLIQKPKSKNARAKGKKGVKQEEQDTDKEENMSDAGGESGDIGGGYLEGPKDANEPQTHSAGGGGGGGGRNRSVDFSALVAQIEAVRSHQIMISQAINRLRKDHQQLYEQSLAFQSLHDRHENSINAILTFLATVYDKSLGGHINGAVNNLFSNQVDQGQGLHRGPPGSNVGVAPAGAIIPTAPTGVRPAVMRTPQMARRKPLLLEGGPTFSGGDSSPMNERNPLHKGNGGSPQVTHQQHLQQEGYQSYQHNTPITELFTPAGGNVTSPADSPQQQHADQHLGVNPPNTTGLYSQPTTPAPTPQTNYASPNIQAAPSNHTTPVPTPRSIARALSGAPFQSTAQALHEHNASLAQKSHEIEELEVLQAKQNENIDNLMGILHGYVDTDPAVGTGGGAGGGGVDSNSDLGPDEVDQFFNFGLQSDGFVDNPFGDDDPHGNVDIDELLRNVEAEGNSNGFNGHNSNPVLTDLTSSAASPTGSSVGSRAREEIEEEIEEVTPKRRRVN